MAELVEVAALSRGSKVCCIAYLGISSKFDRSKIFVFLQKKEQQQQWFACDNIMVMVIIIIRSEIISTAHSKYQLHPPLPPLLLLTTATVVVVASAPPSYFLVRRSYCLLGRTVRLEYARTTTAKASNHKQARTPATDRAGDG